jgi:hypothetical protein
MALLPQHGTSDEEKVLKIDHRGHGVEKEADEVRKDDMRDAIR